MKDEATRDLAAPNDAKKEVARRLGLGERGDGSGGERLGFFPVRHHSPTCAAKLEALLPAFAPDVILVEAPARFEGLREALVDPESRAPMALVAVTRERRPRFEASQGERGAKSRRGAGLSERSYYPFCDYSPELVALKWAAKEGVPARFIDKLAGGNGTEDEEDPALLRALGERLGGGADAPLARSAFTRALAARAGCRDFDELWEVLFEQGGWDDDPVSWAIAVGAYALVTRQTLRPEELAAEGTLERELFMAAKIAEEIGQGRRVLVIAGAVHAVGLGAARERILSRGSEGAKKAARDDAEAEVFVVPYTFPRLDALLGYAPGMSGPAFYQHVWEARGEADPFARAAERALLQAIQRARAEGEALGPADAIASLAFARELARLRGRPRLGRAEVIEAAATCFVKGEIDVAGRRVLAAVSAALRGERVGKLGPRAGASAIAIDFRRTSEALGLFGEGAARVVELDLARGALAVRRSHFLHRAALLELGFAKEQRGPDASSGEGFTDTIERWFVEYTPEVDARLVELSLLGTSVEEASARLLVEGARASASRAGEVAAHVGRAILMGFEEICKRMMPTLEEAIRADEEPTSLLGAGRRLRRTLAFRARLGLSRAGWLEELARAAYEEGVYRLERLASGRGARVEGVPRALADLADAALVSDGAGPSRALVAAKARAARRGTRVSSALVIGALDGLLLLLGEAQDRELAASFSSSAPDAKGPYLEGLLSLAPRALLDDEALLDALIAFVSSGTFEHFLGTLPPLRRAVASLGPRELDELASRAADRLGLAQPEPPLVTPLTSEAVARLAAWERRFLEQEAAWAGPSVPLDAPDPGTNR